MRRVLLVLEDYNELLFLETLLKKVGFDVIAIKNEITLSDQVLSFAPDIVIATGDGNKINGTRVSKKVKKKGQNIKLLLLFPRIQLQRGILLDSSIADAGLETPVHPRSLLSMICELSKVNEELIIGKFEKLAIAKEFANKSEGLKIVSGKVAKEKTQIVSKTEGPDEGVRVKNYDKFLKDLPETGRNGYSRAKVQDEIAFIRETENDPATRDIDEARKDFVKALFKKK